jgi:hypothetical protein
VFRHWEIKTDSVKLVTVTATNGKISHRVTISVAIELSPEVIQFRFHQGVSFENSIIVVLWE